MILLISGQSEFNVTLLERALQRRRAEYATVHPSIDSSNVAITVRSKRVGSSTIRLSGRWGSCSADDISSVWCRATPYFDGHAPDEYTWRNFAVAEQGALYQFLWEQLSDRKWVNPLPLHGLPNRLVQCETAALLGIRVPAAVVSSDPGQLKLFLREHESVILKKISQGSARNAAPCMIMTSKVDCEMDLPDILGCPVLLQEFIPKAYELRVVVVADKVFCAAIDSMSRSETQIDSRDWIGVGLTYYAASLSEAEQAMLVALNRTLGYCYSSMDLVRTPDGDLVFLEANPSGQWSFIEQQVGHDITEEIANVLCG